MEYENRSVPDHINVPREHPLKDFFVLLLGLGALVGLLLLVLIMLADRLVTYIPFSAEAALAEQLFSDDGFASNAGRYPKVENYLQSLVDELSQLQALPDDMALSVHYVDDDVINAFATLGGHIVVHRGLLEKMPSENALSMVLAHEVAHIKHRHPIIATGRGIAVSMALLSLAGLSESAVFERFVGTVGTIANLSFSRAHERLADADALETVLSYYGHAKGADSLFVIVRNLQTGMIAPEFLSTHPLSDARIEKVRSFQNKHITTSSQKLTAIPQYVLAETPAPLSKPKAH